MSADDHWHGCCEQEEARGWDVNEVVFSDAMWMTYQPLLRGDFALFDEYEFTHAGMRMQL